MSSQRSSTAFPSKDRLHSNSPADPVQSSILRDSAKGWGKSSSSSLGLATTPLRIAKRDGKPPFPLVARRSSSSYKHVRNSNLVSKSPFKTQVAIPSKPSTSTSSDTSVQQGTRRVSGEKRPRPDSMHEQAENEKPLGSKRERHQSEAYQGLIEKEPVTKSPFKRAVSAEEELPPPVPPKSLFTPAPAPLPAPPSPPPSAPPSRSVTPSRSSLVSKRLHGPRAVDQTPLDSKRQRRKTVTFDERCDVLEFDRDEEDEDPFYSSDEGEYSGLEHHSEFENLQDHDDAIQEVPSTPLKTTDLLTDTSSELTIPLGRTTHVERAREGHQADEVEVDVNMMPPSPSPAKRPVRSDHSNRDALIPRFELQQPRGESSPKDSHNNLPTADPFSTVKTKEQIGDLSFTSIDDPLDPTNLSIGQSEVSLSNLDLEAELQKVFNPPQSDYEGDIPGLSEFIPHGEPFSTSTPPSHTPPLSFATSGSSSISVGDPVAQGENHPSLQVPSHSWASPVPTPNVSFVSCPASPPASTLQVTSDPPADFSTHPRSSSPLSLSSRLTGSPAFRSGSPSVRTGSPLREFASTQELQGERIPRTRINKEDVHMRLMRKRSMESPLGSLTPGSPAPAVEVSLVESVDEKMPDARSTVAPYTGELGEEDERRLDMTSGMIDTSAEFATIETVEKRVIDSLTVNTSGLQGATHGEEEVDGDESLAAEGDDLLPAKPSIGEPLQPQPTPVRPQSSFSILETSFDLSGSLGAGLRDSMGSIQLGEMRSALDRLMDDVKGSTGSSTKRPNARSQVRVEMMTEGIKAGQFSADTTSTIGDDSMQTETDMDLSTDDFRSAPAIEPGRAGPLPIQRAAMDSVVYTGPSFRSPVEETPPPASPTKDAIKKREELILQKRRQARKRDEDESMGYYTPPRPTSTPPSTSRPSRRRSRSTGDASAPTKSDLLLDIGISDTGEELLADSISKELRRLDPEHRQGKYRVREHEAIFASADGEQVSHTTSAGDVNSGKAWKAVRRPSDMNEYAKQIREYRSQEKPGKAHGKVFVRVLGVKGLEVPIPQQAAALTCTLNNGIHYVTTPETRLSSDARIDQEFELIEHNKLEFTLTLKVRCDPHIVAQFNALVPPPPPPPPPLSLPQPVVPPPKPKGGVFSFLSSSPKKPIVQATLPPPPPPPAPPYKLPDNLARYLKKDGTLARAYISFKDIAARCDTRLLEVKYPLIGQRSEASGNPTTMELGEIVLQIFRLPSLPGVLSHQLPLSLDECLRGLRHVAWHKVTYFESTLTQNGGDCTTWRRRRFRVTGANLIAFNDVTKKAMATINLQKAIAVEDTHDARSAALSPGGRYRDDYDSLIAVERSFRLVFPSQQEILFFADSDEEKVKWLEVLRALVGHIPPNPLWAELVWQRQHEMASHAQQSSSSGRA